jgi:hypothetical protein
VEEPTQDPKRPEQEPLRYEVHYSNRAGEPVSRTYDHTARWRLEKDTILTAEHGWEFEPVTITSVEREPHATAPGLVNARLFVPPEGGNLSTQP